MLAGLALRLAAVEALCPTGALLGEVGAVFPTIAGARVADSRMLPRDDRDPVTALPFIAVYVEEVQGRHDGEAAPTLPFLGTFALVVEMEVRVQDAAPDGAGGGLDEIVPETDPAAEAMLDLMGAQVIFALEVDTRPGGELFRKLRQEVRSVETLPMRVADLGIRLARRTLRITVGMYGDDWSGFVAGGLPEPLATLAAGLPAESYGAAIIATVRAALLDPADLDVLTSIFSTHFASGGLRATADGTLRETVAGDLRGGPGDGLASEAG